MTDLILNRTPSFFSAIARTVNGFFAYVGEVQEAMNRARAKSATFTGSEW